MGVRLYLEKYEPPSGNLDQHQFEVVKPLAAVAMEVSGLATYTGRNEPTVITGTRACCLRLCIAKEWSHCRNELIWESCNGVAWHTGVAVCLLPVPSESVVGLEWMLRR